MVKSMASCAIMLGLCGCSSNRQETQETNLEKPVADKVFASGGNIEMQLDGGNYVIRPAAEDRIRAAFGGNTGNAGAEITSNGTQANLAVKDTPQNNFKASIEVPKASNLVIHLKAGNLELRGITGNKDIDSGAGNVEIAAGDPNDYSRVDASVKVGSIDAGAFGKSESGIAPHFTWTGQGKYTLHATLGAGNLELKK
jgi:hypothetical protein